MPQKHIATTKPDIALQQKDSEDDEIPRDIEEFRRELERRLNVITGSTGECETGSSV